METIEQVEARTKAKIEGLEIDFNRNAFKNHKTLVFTLLEGVKKKMNDDALFNENIIDIQEKIRQELRKYYGL